MSLNEPFFLFYGFMAILGFIHCCFGAVALLSAITIPHRLKYKNLNKKEL